MIGAFTPPCTLQDPDTPRYPDIPWRTGPVPAEVDGMEQALVMTPNDVLDVWVVGVLRMYATNIERVAGWALLQDCVCRPESVDEIVENQADYLETEIRAVIETIPNAVWVMEEGGSENIAASLAVSVAGLCSKVKRLTDKLNALQSGDTP